MPTPTPVQPKADDDITASFEAARTRANASPDLAPARTVSLGSAPDHMSAGWEPSVREGASVPPGLPATWDAGRHALADRDKAWDAARQADVDRRGGVIEKLGEPAIAAYTDAQRRQYEPDTLTFAQKAARFGRTAFMLPSQMAEMGISAAKGAAGAVAGPAVDLLGPDTLHPAGGESDEPGVAGRPQTWDAARAANRGEPWKGPRSERWSQEGVGVAKALAAGERVLFAIISSADSSPRAWTTGFLALMPGSLVREGVDCLLIIEAPLPPTGPSVPARETPPPNIEVPP